MEKVMLLPTLQATVALFAFLTLASFNAPTRPVSSDEEIPPTEAGTQAMHYYSLRGF